MALNAGELRHRVAIDRVVRGTDEQSGAVLESWEVFEDNSGNGIPAAIKPLSVRDFIASQAAQSEAMLRVVIRWMPGVEPLAMRVRDLEPYGLVYRIIGVLPDDDSGREWLTLAVAQGVTDGR